jgi:hypothetical protein
MQIDIRIRAVGFGGVEVVAGRQKHFFWKVADISGQLQGW